MAKIRYYRFSSRSQTKLSAQTSLDKGNLQNLKTLNNLKIKDRFGTYLVDITKHLP